MRLHVCHVWDRFWPLEIGGLERYILWLSNYLAKKDAIEFSLITGRTKILLITKNIKKYEDSGFLKVHRLGPSPADIVNGFCMFTLGFTPKPVEKMKFASLYREAAQSKLTKTADIFHIHGIWSDFEYIKLGISLSRRYKKPLVVTLHGGFVGDPLHGGMPLESASVREILENDAAAITTYSKEVLGVLERMGLGYKSHYVTNFVDTFRFRRPPQAQSSPHDVTVVYVGRLEPVQTPDLVVEAFKKVNDRFPNAKLTLVGYGRMFEQLKLQIKRLNLENAVTLTGKQTDVRRYLWQSDVFVATNFGYIATLEAWAAGLAVVAPNFGVLKETVTDRYSGLLFEPNNALDLADKLTLAIEDATLRKWMIANGARIVQGYDIRAVAPKMSAIYRSVANQNDFRGHRI